mgnify:CR=1 FL=1
MYQATILSIFYTLSALHTALNILAPIVIIMACYHICLICKQLSISDTLQNNAPKQESADKELTSTSETMMTNYHQLMLSDDHLKSIETKLNSSVSTVALYAKDTYEIAKFIVEVVVCFHIFFTIMMFIEVALKYLTA